MQLLNGLGDSRLVLLGALVTSGMLAAYRQYDALRRFVFGLACCLVAIFVTKLVGLSLAGLGFAFPIGSPSGHAALCAFFVGALTLLAMVRHGAFVGALMVIAAVGLVLAVGYGRIANDAHTIIEVVEGQFIGSICLIPLAMRGTLTDAHSVPSWPLLGCIVFITAYRAFIPQADLDTESLVMKLTQYIVLVVGKSQ